MSESAVDSSRFTWPVRVYWEDTDAGGVVYHAGYLRFMERARSEWMRAAGVDQTALRERTGLGFVVRDMQIDYFSPARLDDELRVTAAVQTMRRASLTFMQSVRRGEADVDLVRARVRVACVDLVKMRPAPIPEDLIARIS